MAISSRSIAAPDKVSIQRALISVFDKTGLLDLAAELAKRNVELLSTGGTARALKEAGYAVKAVGDADADSADPSLFLPPKNPHPKVERKQRVITKHLEGDEGRIMPPW